MATDYDDWIRNWRTQRVQRVVGQLTRLGLVPMDPAREAEGCVCIEFANRDGAEKFADLLSHPHSGKATSCRVWHPCVECPDEQGEAVDGNVGAPVPQADASAQEKERELATGIGSGIYSYVAFRIDDLDTVTEHVDGEFDLVCPLHCDKTRAAELAPGSDLAASEPRANAKVRGRRLAHRYAARMTENEKPRAEHLRREAKRLGLTLRKLPRSTRGARKLGRYRLMNRNVVVADWAGLDWIDAVLDRHEAQHPGTSAAEDSEPTQ